MIRRQSGGRKVHTDVTIDSFVIVYLRVICDLTAERRLGNRRRMKQRGEIGLSRGTARNTAQMERPGRKALLIL